MIRKITAMIIALLAAVIMTASVPQAWGEENVSGGTVTLPLQTFLNLTKKPPSPGGAPTAPKAPGETLPVRYIFTSGRYAVTATPWNARVEGDISLVIYGSGWVEVPFVKKSVAISSVQLDGNELPLFVKDGNYCFMGKGEGTHSLKVAFYVNTSKNSNTTSIAFAVPQTTVSNIDAVVPMTRAQVSIASAIIKSQYEKNGKTVVEATIPSAENDVVISWTPKAVIPSVIKAAKNERPKLYAVIDTILSVKQDAITATSFINYSILYNKVSQFSFAIPKGAGIVNVSGANFLNWEKKEGKDEDVISVLLSSGVEGSYTLTVEYEKPIGKINSTWPLPQLSLLGVERQKGTFGCLSEDNIEITMAGLQGAGRIDEKDLPLEVRNKAAKPILLAFKYQAIPCQISLETRKLDEVPVLATTIDIARAITVVNDEGTGITTLTYEMRNNEKQYLDLTLPLRSRLLGAFVNNLPVKPVKGKGDAVKIPLLKSKGEGAAEAFIVEITYLTDLGEFRGFTAKKVLPPLCSIPISDFYWSLYLPREQRVLRFGGTMQLVTESDVRMVTERVSAPGDLQQNEAAMEKKCMKEESEISVAGKDKLQMKPSIARQRDFEGATLARIDQVVSSSTKGVNPVKISIPQAGRLYRFNKLLVIDRSPAVIAYCYQNWIYSALLLVSFGAVLAMGVALANRGVTRKAGAMAVLSLIVLIAVRTHLGEFFKYGMTAFFLAFLYWLWITYSGQVIDALKLKAGRNEAAAS
ncbi:MAG: hypothetical protein RDV48_17190 [Candidatus Eremiobacteraeota bacterium]|nr:hypothetical protein [Candidatus Eremiobacteraeota bacterium]